MSHDNPPIYPVKMDLGQADVHVDGALKVRTDMEFTLSSKLDTKDEVDAEMKRLEEAKTMGTVGDEDYKTACSLLSNAMNRFGDAIGDRTGDSHGKQMKGECVDVVQLSADDNTKQVWIQVAKQGKFRGHPSGPFEMNAATFAQIIHNFRSTKNQAVPVDFEHASEQAPTDGQIPVAGAPAQGWITELVLRPDGNLWGLVEWLPLAKKYIKSKQYRFLSPAIVFGAKDRVTGKDIGAYLSSVALTNSPFLDGLQPVAAKYAVGTSGEAESPGFVQLRAALEFPEAVRPSVLLAMLTTSGSAAFSMSKVRDALRLPLTFSDEQVFNLAQVVCGKPLELPPPVLPAVSNNKPLSAEQDSIMTLEEKKELETRVAQLTLKQNEADAEIKSLKTSHAEELRLLTATNAELVARLAVHDDRELNDLVDTAIGVYGEKKGLTDKDRPHLLTFAKGAKEAFTAMYPQVPVNQRHLGLKLATGDHQVNRQEITSNVVNMSDMIKEANIPDVGVLAAKKITDAKAIGITMSREDAFVAAHNERVQLVTAAAKKRAGMGG